MSMEEVSEACFTSSITINRLLKKVHCATFRAFKQEVKDVLDGYSKFNRVFPYSELSVDDIQGSYFNYLLKSIDDLSNTLDHTAVEQACALLHDSPDIHFYCEYSSSHAKQQLQVDLMLYGKNVVCLSDIEAQKLDSDSLTAQSVVMATSITAYAHFPEHISLMKKIRGIGTKVVILAPTSTPNPQKYADLLLEFHGTETAMDNYLVDMIFNVLGITYRTQYID